MRRGLLIVVLVLLLLSLLGNAGLLWTYSNVLPDVQQLRQEVDRQAQELQQLQEERDGLGQQVQTLQQEKRSLEEEKGRLEEELAALQSQQSQGDILEQVDRLEADVRAQRRLVPVETVLREFVSQEKLLAHLEEAFAREYSREQAAVDAEVLTLLGLLKSGTDLYQVQLDLHTEQAWAFYDLAGKRLYVIGGIAPGLLEQLAFAHEYIRALQDQSFDLGSQVDAVSDDSDRARALGALSEGDATLATELFMLVHPDEFYNIDTLSQTLGLETPRFNAAPAVVRAELLFVYKAGLNFVLSLYARRGWSSVDAAWGDPPQSSEQILHPERYPDDAPQLVTLPALTRTLGSGWRFQGEDTLGEFMLRQHLQLYLDADQVDHAATGWGGDHYALYVNQSQRAACLVIRLVWDDSDEAEEFAKIYQGYAKARYGLAGTGEVSEGMWWDRKPGLYLQWKKDEVLVIMAPDQGTAEDVAQTVR